MPSSSMHTLRSVPATYIVISQRDMDSDRIGPIGFCGQLGVIVVIGIQVEDRRASIELAVAGSGLV